MKQPRKILVTGGSGFIGSNFIRYLLRDNENVNVLNLDLLTYAGNPDNLKDIENDPRYRFNKGDIRDKSVVDRCVADCDLIVHFAAESHVDRSIKDASVFLETNIIGTYVLLQSALEKIERNEHFEKFIMISTDEVYGDIPKGVYSSESDPLMPMNPYAASKAGADRLAFSYNRTHGLPVIITRASNNYGPYQYPEKFIPLMITNILEGKKVPVYGDGRNIRDWLYVKDNCQAIELLIEKGKIGEVYNIGSSNEKKNIEVVRMILDILEKDESSIQYVTDRKGHDRRYSMDYSKIMEDVGWKPEHELEGSLKDTIEWYMNNQTWWKKMK